MAWNSNFRIDWESGSQVKFCSFLVGCGMHVANTILFCCKNNYQTYCKPFFGGHIHCRLYKMLIKLWPRYSEGLAWTQKTKAIFELGIPKYPCIIQSFVIICKVIFPDQRETSPTSFEPIPVDTVSKFQDLLKSWSFPSATSRKNW